LHRTCPPSSRVCRLEPCAPSIDPPISHPNSPPYNPCFCVQDWNESATVIDMPYHVAKTAAERRAHELAAGQSRWRLAVINPTYILGPPLSSRVDGESVGTFK